MSITSTVLPSSIDEVAALAKMVGLNPVTMAWIYEEPPPPATPPPRYQYEPLSDSEWEVISPHWPMFNQSKTNPRDIVNALLMKAATGCSWGDVSAYATVEAARQQFKRRARSGVLGFLPDVLLGQLDEGRLAQFVKLAGLSRLSIERWPY